MRRDFQVLIVRLLRHGSDGAIFVLLSVIIGSFGVSWCWQKNRAAHLGLVSHDVTCSPEDNEREFRDVATPSHNVNSLSRSVSALSEDAGRLSRNIDVLSNNVGELSTHAEILSANVDTLTGNAEALTDNVETLTGNVEALSGTVGAQA